MNIYEQAVIHFGEQKQIRKMVEECIELSQALIHLPDGKSTQAECCDELADVLIMYEQMRILYGAEDIDRHVGIWKNCLKTEYSEAELIDVIIMTCGVCTLILLNPKPVIADIYATLAKLNILLFEVFIIFGAENVRIAIDRKLKRLEVLLP